MKDPSFFELAGDIACSLPTYILANVFLTTMSLLSRCGFFMVTELRIEHIIAGVLGSLSREGVLTHCMLFSLSFSTMVVIKTKYYEKRSESKG